MANPLFSPIFAPGMQGGAYINGCIIVYGISTNRSQKSFLNENMQACTCKDGTLKNQPS